MIITTKPEELPIRKLTFPCGLYEIKAIAHILLFKLINNRAYEK